MALTEGLSLEIHKHSLNKSSKDEEKLDIMDSGGPRVSQNKL